LRLPGIAVSMCVPAYILTRELNGVDAVQTCSTVSQLQTNLHYLTVVKPTGQSAGFGHGYMID